MTDHHDDLAVQLREWADDLAHQVPAVDFGLVVGKATPEAAAHRGVRFLPRRTSLAVAALVLVVVGAGAWLVRGRGADERVVTGSDVPDVSTEGSAPATTGVPLTVPAPAESGSVTADEYWSATVDAMTCVETFGVPIVGPYPAADGSRIEYAYAETPATAQAESECLGPILGLERDFQLNHTPEQAGRLASIASELRACLMDAGVELDSTSGADLVMQSAAESAPERFRECANNLR